MQHWWANFYQYLKIKFNCLFLRFSLEPIAAKALVMAVVMVGIRAARIRSLMMNKRFVGWSGATGVSSLLFDSGSLLMVTLLRWFSSFLRLRPAIGAVPISTKGFGILQVHPNKPPAGSDVGGSTRKLYVVFFKRKIYVLPFFKIVILSLPLTILVSTWADPKSGRSNVSIAIPPFVFGVHSTLLFFLSNFSLV